MLKQISQSDMLIFSKVTLECQIFEIKYIAFCVTASTGSLLVLVFIC